LPSCWTRLAARSTKRCDDPPAGSAADVERIMTTFDVQGLWWLPEYKNHRVPGTLVWNAESGGQLGLHGEIRPVVWNDNVLSDGSIQKYRDPRTPTDQQYPIILGQAGPLAYTLVRSFSLSLRESADGDSIERVHVNEVLEGAWFTSPEDLQADRVFIDLRHLTGWVDRSGLSASYPSTDDPSDPRFAIVTATALPSLKTDCGDVDVRLVHRLGTSGDHIHSLVVKQGWSLQLTRPALTPISRFLDTASDIQDLLSIAVGMTASFDRVVIQHPDLLALSLAGTPFGGGQRADITFHAGWSNHADPCEPVVRHNMYFTFADLGGIDAVGRWLDQAERYRTELGRVMATRYSTKMYVEDRIMNICAALDSFDKVRRGTSADYVERIKQCVALAGPPFLNLIHQDPAGWARAVKEARHDLAHHRERFRLDGSVGEHLLAEQLFWLFTMCMLRLAEAAESAFDSLAHHRQIQWLTEQARGAPA
jgi:hypothetical protein